MEKLEELMLSDKLSSMDLNGADLLQNDDDVEDGKSYYAVNLTPANLVLSINGGERTYQFPPSLSPDSVKVMEGKYVRTPEVTQAQSQGKIAIFKSFNLFAYQENRRKAQAEVAASRSEAINSLLGDPYQRQAATEGDGGFQTRIDLRKHRALYDSVMKIAENADQNHPLGTAAEETYKAWKEDYKKNVK